MKKVVREISFKERRDVVKIIGYSASDRGTRFVNKVFEISTVGKTKQEVDLEVQTAIAELLGPQQSR